MAAQDTVALSTTAVVVIAATDRRLRGKDGIIYVKNLDASITVTLGDADVVANEGLVLEAGQREAIPANLQKDLYAIAASGTPNLTYYIA